MKQVRVMRKGLWAALLSAAMLLTASITALAAPAYVHDPMLNPRAAEDIIVNPNAVYGYSPNPDAGRLKDYAGFDWTDPENVARMQQERIEYHDSMKELYAMIAYMEAAGASTEEIARAVSTRRNEMRLESYQDDPRGLEEVKKSNLEKYGNEMGGTPEFFYNKYGSWETVLEKSLSSNAGMDACLGLYDTYYDTYYWVRHSQYTVVSGDSLSSIAEKQLGDRTMWRDIFNLNKGLIRDPNRIYPGQVLALR